MEPEIREQLKQAVAHIRAGEIEKAREILRPLCDANNADAWWLLAQTTRLPKQIRFALEKAVQVDPNHERAVKQLAVLDAGQTLEPAIIPAPRPKPAAEVFLPEKPKAKKSPSAGRFILRLLIVLVGGLLIGLAIFIIVISLTYTIPPPVLGPFYVRYQVHYLDGAPSPCKSFLVFGKVINGAGLTAHLWDQNGDQTTVVGSDGSFQFVMPASFITYRGEAGDHYLGDSIVQLQLSNGSGTEQSGINHLWFLRSCAMYVEYWQHDYGGRRIGNINTRPRSWLGPYDVAYSAITTTPLLICDFNGFTGTAYDDNGPMRDLQVQIHNLDDTSPKPTYHVTDTGHLDVQMGPSSWYLFAEPEHAYLLQVVSPNNVIIITDIIYLPKKEGCEKNVIKVSISQAERRDGVPLPPLPADWVNS